MGAAGPYYQQSLALKIEFNDRYTQASTYHQLGGVAERAAAVAPGRGLLPAGPGPLRRVQRPLRTGQHLPPVGQGGAGAAAVAAGVAIIYLQALEIFIAFEDRYQQGH